MKYLTAFLLLFTGVQLCGQAGNLNYSLVPAGSGHPGYFEHLPDAYANNPDKHYPVIIFLHGQGERDFGRENDLNSLLKWGPPRIVSQNLQAYKAIHPFRFIILAPQQRGDKNSWEADDVDSFMSYAFENYRIDPERVYLTGISMGGNGVWNYAYSEYNSPNKLAAIAPISAWGDPGKGCEIVSRNIPVWSFHGLNDQVVPFREGQRMFASLNQCEEVLNSDDYRFSPLNAEHTAWPGIYASASDSISVYEWFMDHVLRSDTIIDDSNTSIEEWTPPPSFDAELVPSGQFPEVLNENSGLAYDSEGNLWTHNDSGNDASLFQVSETGEIIREVHIGYSKNMDWEDLAADRDGNFYIGDIGNNLNVRNKLFIYKVSKDELKKEIPQAETISFVYEDQRDFPPSTSEMHYDAESLIHYDGSLYIFTKNRTEPFTGYTHIYRLPDTPGDYTAQLVDSLKLGEGLMTNFWLTSADISPDGQMIALLSHDKLWILTCFNGKKFSQGQLTEYRLNSYTQKESVTFKGKNTLFLSDERIRNILGGNIYSFEIPAAVMNVCD